MDESDYDKENSHRQISTIIPVMKRNQEGCVCMLSREIIDEIINGLLKAFGDNVLQIILYGSVARKQATEESDVDIAVVLEREFNYAEREEFLEWVAELDLKYDKVFSVIDIERENYEKWGAVLPFYKNIKRDGIVLWNKN